MGSVLGGEECGFQAKDFALIGCGLFGRHTVRLVGCLACFGRADRS
jgi:hypothetical protein